MMGSIKAEQLGHHSVTATLTLCLRVFQWRLQVGLVGLISRQLCLEHGKSMLILGEKKKKTCRARGLASFGRA